ncbi:MAG: ShlB/FhaC/HecB family hemolysin secretion/activation protein [Steroidobacteraceae bacterium]|jgi:hemolysin activation/secretion protein
MIRYERAPTWVKAGWLACIGLAYLACGHAWGADTPGSGGDKTAEARFDVHEYRVLGNSVLSDRDIERTLYPMLGDNKTLADVEAARAALEKAYHDRGYQTVFVDIPEQDVADAIVRLRVTEGKFRNVSISGARYYSERKILAALPEAKPGTVPSLPALQEQLAAVNSQTADRTVIPVLKAGADPGTVDLALKVDDHSPLHGSVDLNNQYSPDTKPLRATVALNYNNLFDRLDSISAQYQDSPQQPGEVDVAAANYALGPLASGLRPSVYYIHSNSNAATIGTIGVLGKGDIYGLRVSYPIFESPGVTQSLVFGGDYKHFRNTIGLASQPALVTPVSYTNLSLGYSGSWSSARLQDLFSASANFGPRGAPNNPESFENNRFMAHPNYFYVRADENLLLSLPAGLHLKVRVAGQYADEALISNENYSIAGADGVRGYLEAESLGDSAIKGTLQLESPTWILRARTIASGFVYFDAGRDNLIDALSNVPSVARLRSTGLGLDLWPGRPVTGAFTWAYPLVDGPRTRRDESRLLFDIKGSF